VAVVETGLVKRVDAQTNNTTSKKACLACGQEFATEAAVCPNDGTALVALCQEDLIGTTLADRYEILDIIGEGGMGAVYKARHLLMDRLVAIKMLHPHMVADQSNLKRFQREAKAASCLQHPNVIAVYDFGLTDKGQPYLVMDYLQGISLEDLLEKDGRVEPERGVRIFIQVCEALAQAHASGVIHRDLKPSNIMLIEKAGKSDFVKIVDFGIAKLLPESGKDSQQLTQTGAVFGSPLYMSPEHCLGKTLDPRSDVYALGCVMYEAFTGKHPLMGPTAFETMKSHLSKLPSPFRLAGSDLQISDELEHLVFKALAKDADKRQQSMLELKAELEAVLGSIIGSKETEEMPLPEKLQLSRPADRLQQEPRPDRRQAPPVISDQQPGSSSGKKPGAPLAKPDSQEERPGPAGGKPGGLRASLAIALVLGLILILAAGAWLAHSFWPAARAPSADAVNPQERARLWQEYDQEADRDEEAGEIGKQKEVLRAAIELAERFGPTDPRLAKSLYRLGVFERDRGDYAEAEALLRRAWQIREASLGPTDPDVARSLEALGQLYQMRGDHSQAEEMYKRALKLVSEGGGGSTGAEGPTPADNLARLYDSDGKHQEAAALLEKVLEADRQAFGGDTPHVAQDLSNLAGHYQATGDYARAESLYKQATTIWERVDGADSPDLAQGLTRLGSLYADQGRYREAEDVVSRGMKIRERKFGLDNPAVADSVYLLAKIADQKKAYIQAESLYKHALSILEKTRGEAHSETAAVLGDYAQLLRRTNRGQEAEALQARIKKGAAQDQGG